MHLTLFGQKSAGLLAFFLFLFCLPVLAFGELSFDAVKGMDWMLNLSDYLMGETPLNDPVETGDLSRPGQYLLQYDFGTVITEGTMQPSRGCIAEATMETSKIADCLGFTVGMNIEAIGDARILEPLYPLTLISMQQEGIGWMWVYGKEGHPYGIEWVSYQMEEEKATEVTLTYTVENQVIKTIRIKQTPMTREEAMGNLESVGEMNQAQSSQAKVIKNQEAAFSGADALLNGESFLSVEVYRIIARLGEPESVQSLPGSQGRLLLYPGAVFSCNLEEMTGVERIDALTVASDAYTGPREVQVGMTLNAVAALFRSDHTISSAGGTLYQEARNQGQLVRYDAGEETLIYRASEQEREIVFEMSFREERMVSWRIYTEPTQE